MKIVHVNFARGFRGGERQTLNLIEGLVEHGIDQTLICRPGSELGARLSAKSVRIVAVAHPLLGHLKQLSADLTHVHEARGAYWAAIEKGIRKTPYLISRRIQHSISNSRFTRSVYAGAAALVGVSKEVARGLQQQTARPVWTIFDSCTRYAADPARVAAIRARLGGDPIIGHVGALVDRDKGQSILIDAFKRFSFDYPEARLVFLGDGPDRALFERLAGSDARIIFAGFQDEIGCWIGALDLFAFPSREEGLGSSVLDAMLLKVPVIAAAVGGLPELIGDQQRGKLVMSHRPEDWDAALRAAMHELPTQQNKLDAAHEFAQQHDTAAMVDRYMNLYQLIVRRPGEAINPDRLS